MTDEGELEQHAKAILAKAKPWDQRLSEARADLDELINSVRKQALVLDRVVSDQDEIVEEVPGELVRRINELYRRWGDVA